MPDWLQEISAWDPIRYAIDGMRQAVFYPNLIGVGADLVALTATALAALILGFDRHSPLLGGLMLTPALLVGAMGQVVFSFPGLPPSFLFPYLKPAIRM